MKWVRTLIDRANTSSTANRAWVPTSQGCAHERLRRARDRPRRRLCHRAVRLREELIDQRLREPFLVAVEWPTSVHDEEAVHLGRGDGVNDVAGVALDAAQAAARPSETMNGKCDLGLPVAGG